MAQRDTSSAPIRLNLGCGRDIVDGWVNIDHVERPGVDLVFDLERCGEEPLPYEDDSVVEISLSHVLEHVQNALPLMEELYRVAANNCLCTIRVPHGASDDAWTDPTHIRPYFRGSFGYFSQPHYWRADYGYRGDWQPEKIHLMVDERKYGWMKPKRLRYAVSHERNMVHEIVAELRAVKPAREQLRENQVAAVVNIQKFVSSGTRTTST